ncbi:MAG: hypothetical protein ACE5GJ_07185 [Gemmatimonadota bacterium]
MLTLKILGAVVALGLGVWFGLPGRYRPDLEEIERAMESPAGRSRTVRRHFTPLAWLQRTIRVGRRRRARTRERGTFHLERPEDR